MAARVEGSRDRVVRARDGPVQILGGGEPRLHRLDGRRQPSAAEPVMGSDENAVQELRVSRSSKAVKGKRKVETKKARVKRRAVPERMRSERRVEEVTHGAGNYGTNGSRDNAGRGRGGCACYECRAQNE